ncbi:uncharacterized protein PV09_00305 [Verruconis gallopava]|uniref:Brix domain-containing protein n=1 Tax=Verruconis gallopava TaxID=253628 RepID=A0A0D2ASB3_9PEZI|nr:uncharacterized protein PV09_00305 [Verruconis gallopava]KIW09415.1 hypothetical protein PV09_00305 [Verruconis gallopava]
MPKKNISAKFALPYQSANKDRRKQFHIKQKKARDVLKREERFARKKEEARDPRLREERLRTNVPKTIDLKRTWDEIGDDDDEASILGKAVDLAQLAKRRKIEEEQQMMDESDAGSEVEDEGAVPDKDDAESDIDSMLDSGSESDEEDEEGEDEDEDEKAFKKPYSKGQQRRQASPNPSTTSTNLNLTPESLVSKFPTLFAPLDKDPKILITTSINSTLHDQARLLTELFPNSVYVRRSAHRFGHKFSVKEIAGFAANRNYTALIIMMEDQKKPCGLDFVHLPNGPMFHFSLTNWVEGRKLPGHGNATNHYPELILNNFRTPLGLLTAHLFKTLWPRKPEIQGRQVVTMHNQRDFIFFRRHRYVFRDKRATEKSVVGTDGKPMAGVEDIRAGLQELGPRFTLKLRRVDKGIQRSSGQEWEWKTKTDKVRTKFQL